MAFVTSNGQNKGIRVLITGACGFLGTAVVRHALEAGLSVRCTDCKQSINGDQTHYVQADILQPVALKPAVSGVDAVIHTAGLAHVFGKSKVRSQFTAVNEIGTANLARAAAAAGVKHFVLISSVSVYGNSGGGQCRENALCRPESAYAQSKYQAELRAKKVTSEPGMNLTILRMATIYGEDDPGNIYRLISSIDRGRFVWIGKGANQKSLLYRDDAAWACMAALSNPVPGVRIYNVSAGACTMREIVEMIARYLGQRLPRWHIPARLMLGCTSFASGLSLGLGPFASIHGLVRKWLSDNVYPADKIQNDLGFRPQVTLAEGLRREVDWYKGRIASTADRTEKD